MIEQEVNFWCAIKKGGSGSCPLRFGINRVIAHLSCGRGLWGHGPNEIKIIVKQEAEYACLTLRLYPCAERFMSIWSWSAKLFSSHIPSIRPASGQRQRHRSYLLPRIKSVPAHARPRQFVRRFSLILTSRRTRTTRRHAREGNTRSSSPSLDPALRSASPSL